MLSSEHTTGLTTIRGLRPSQPLERLGIVAGGGMLPLLIAQEAKDLGWQPFIVAIADGRQRSWEGWDHISLPWSRTGDVFDHLRRRNVSKIVFSGTISVRPDYRSMLPSWPTLKMLPELFRMTQGGDDSLLRAVAQVFERRGVEVLSVQTIMPDLLLPLGNLTNVAVVANHEAAIGRAEIAAVRLGLLDIGQAVVASQDRIIALEGIEGTRELLLRVADLRSRKRIGRGEACVLFKAFKPQQDMRFDLPSIGVETIAQAEAAGIAGIAMTAKRSLVIEPQKVADAAQAAGLFVLGVQDVEDGRL
ncbi:LpxI family protein [Aureimonas sp. N4]|uniref:LpxI family protein n=1 Tax=Aureimonas sp. N4 TaxID=1638165 RepID=UPI00244ED8F0|nr:UDP-2,3-diacylglucosamine diphosphatase LpxI [Aureimonas sp. N4]